MTEMELTEYDTLVVRQKREMAELFGFETRNKYEVLDSSGKTIAYAAEQSKSFLGILFRQLFGHWRRFDIHVYDSNRQEVMIIKHPFRFLFQRVEIFAHDGQHLGNIQQHFSILNKSFSLEDFSGSPLMSVKSPIWKLWTFPFTKNGNAVAVISKRWSGILTEIFTDKDSFTIQFKTEILPNSERMLLLAASLFIDLNYFERKAGK